MRFRQRVAVQGPIAVRTAAGGVGYTYETLSGLGSVPANVQASTKEQIGERETIIEDLFSIDLAGYFPDLAPDMIVLDGVAVYDIKRIVPTLRHEITIVKAQRVAI